MNNKERILLSLSLVILISVLGSLTGSENVLSGGLPTTTDSTPVSSENVSADNVTTSDLLGVQLDFGNASLNESASEYILPTESGGPTPEPKPIFAPLGNGPIGPVHNLRTHENFSTIQDAIDAPNTTGGDIIEVDPETYTENVNVNKPLTIRSTSGNHADTIVQANNSNDHVFEVTVDWVNISGFTVKNANELDMAGIYLNGVANCNISDCSVTNNGQGVLFVYTTNSRIENVNASNNHIGIALISSSGNTIRNNLLESNIEYGIYLESSNDNIVTNNTARFTKSWSGISLWDSCGNKITNNSVKSNLDGIELLNISCNNLIDNNIVTSNDGSGIVFWIWSGSDFYDNNTITNNTASYNGRGGIELYTGSNNTIKNNIANSNGGSGIALWYWTYNNTLENNTVSNNEYSGIELGGYKNNIHNIIKNNTARHNNVSGIALFRSSSDNNVSDNELSSNQFGLSVVQLSDIASNNQIMNNTISGSKSHGIYLLDLKYANNVTNNTVSNSNLYGILAENSSNSNIINNTANLNERGIGLVESSTIEVMDNVANSNKISGLALINSTNNKIFNNTARNNTYEGIYLSNSSLNNISENNVSGSLDSKSYFGISLYSSNNNDIVNNNAGSNYYFEVFQYNSNNTITPDYNQTYNQTDEIRGVRMYVPEARTPSLQSVTPSTNATYDIVVENLGNMPDTFDLKKPKSNDQYAVSLDKNIVSLGPGAIYADTTYEIPLWEPQPVKMNVETIKLNVSGNEPGVCRVNVEAISTNDQNVSDSVVTWTIVQGEVDSAAINSPIIHSALINSSITNSVINRSAIKNSIIYDSTITDSIILNSEVVGTSLSDVILEEAIVNTGNILSGTLTINDITYEITNEIKISDLVTGSDNRDSDLVGIKSGKTLNVVAESSSTSFDISAQEDYFAGSMRVQKSNIPPNGIPEFTNNVGGYVYVNASDNLNKSTGWLIIKVFYDENELGDLDENSLTLRYYNVSANRWEDIPIRGINRIENYVWGNTSHYSVFSVSGSVTPKGVLPMPGGGRAPLDNDDDGLSTIQELIIGTDPDNPDTDGDGLKDGEDPFPLDPNLPVRFKPTPTPVPPPGVTMIPTVPTGFVNSSVTAYSADGKASVTISAGTIAKDAAGNPLTEVTITLPSALPAGVPSGVEYLDYAIQVGPEGATFSQPVEISIIFDPAKFEGKKPVIYVYEAGAWWPLETTVEGNKATTKVDHFSILVLFAEQSAPTPTPTPPPPAFPSFAPFPVVPMVVVIAIIVVVVIIGAVVYMVRRRR